MKRLETRLLQVALAGLSMLTLGCGGGEPRGEVHGSVVFNGEPVAAGVVSFESTGGTSPARNVPIRDGQYRADGDAALAPGTYRVRIAAGDPAAEAAQPGGADPQHSPVEYRPLLPPSWNAQSQLSVEVRDGANTFNFSGEKGELPRVETP